MKVVNRVEPGPEDLVHPLQMMEVGAGEMAACIAAAGRIERPGIGAVFGVADLDVAIAGEEPAVSGVARGQHAVEKVYARTDTIDDVLRRAHAHQVPR